jgi:hypothetical protein
MPTEDTSQMVTVRTFSAESRTDEQLFGPCTEVEYAVCGLSSHGATDSSSQTSIVS